MRSLLHISNNSVRKHYCSTSRCIVPLLLLLAAVAASNVYFTYPNRGRLQFPRPFSSRITRRGEGCDIFRGDWVPDPDAPYYTNDTCSVIHEHYDCMRYGKPDLGFVKWRWQPDGCDLPRLDPWRFLDLMRGKSIAFVGDSLARNHKDSLICLLTRAAEPTPSWPNSRHTVYYYGEYNFTVDPSQYEGGEWNKDGNCVRTRPYRRGEKKVQGFELDFRNLQVLTLFYYYLFLFALSTVQHKLRPGYEYVILACLHA
ncbi:unnamed protein product [Urochloa decumbens]|uniref:Trichome birefringence-like N-terminal domain-containing protein n=1 Tax=Urochloa decumbens TaxID=240449 RepID=A0ABC8XSS9_9POAL